MSIRFLKVFTFIITELSTSMDEFVIYRILTELIGQTETVM